MQPKAVIFDWGGTLTPWHNVDLRGSWAAFAHGFGLLACSQYELTSRLAAADKLAYQQARRELNSYRLTEILADCGVAADSAAGQSGLAAYFDWWEPHTITHPWTEPTLAALTEAGIKVGLLSNTMWPREYHDGLLARDGVLDYFDATVYTSELVQVKPHAEPFLAALAALDLGVDDAESVIFVGDRLREDVEGAAALGMRTVWLNHGRYGSRDLAEMTTISAKTRPDYTISELPEVIEIILGR